MDMECFKQTNSFREELSNYLRSSNNRWVIKESENWDIAQTVITFTTVIAKPQLKALSSKFNIEGIYYNKERDYKIELLIGSKKWKYEHQ
jgi:hypothetical protein